MRIRGSEVGRLVAVIVSAGLIVAAALALAACGDSDGSPSPSPTGAGTSPAPGASPVTLWPGQTEQPAGLADMQGDGSSDLLLGSAALPAPGWVREGTRLSYYSATADIPSAYERFILDENGAWVGQTSGKRYRREELYAAAGHGVTQVDVLSVGETVTALKVGSWLYSSYTGPLLPIGSAASICPVAGGDWYIHPAALAEIPDQLGDELQILRMPYTIEGVTYDAVRVQQVSDRATFARVYDLADGKLLATFNAVASKDGRSTVFAHALFIGVRQMDLPWLGQDLPGWLTGATTVTYAGAKSYEAILAGSVLTADVSVRMTMDDVAPAYYTYVQDSTAYVPGFPSQSSRLELIGGIGEPAGLALPPAALASLRAGQTIDSDPVTGITTEVLEAGTGSGRDVVVIRLSNQAYTADSVYDVGSGALLRFSETKRAAETNEYLELTLQGE